MVRGRLAPSPTGYLHLGHARTFFLAHQRMANAGGTMVLRTEDLDQARCRAIYTRAALEDLAWLGIRWHEGPDCGGPHAPYTQMLRMEYYRRIFEQLRAEGWLYPCTCTRKDVATALTAPHALDDEPIYAGTCRPAQAQRSSHPRNGVNWRFRLPHGTEVAFEDGELGAQSATAGVRFGDFVAWRKDDLPSYQLAVVADDIAMRITEVVRGADLVTSTFRQLLIYTALRAVPPRFFHTALILDAEGNRLAKRADSLAIRTLREQGYTKSHVLEKAFTAPTRPR
jgi:glutamyl-tRNA synthetase